MTPREFLIKACYWIYFRLLLHRAVAAFWRGQLSARYTLIDRHRHKRPYLILAAMRTGTNYLISMLNSAGISCKGEILSGMGNMHTPAHRVYADPRVAAMRHLRRSIYTQGGRLGGAKIFAWHLDIFGMTISDLEAALPGCRYIILYRASLADQYYSLVIARRTHTWFLTNRQAFKDPGPLRIEREEFENFCDRIRRAYTAYLSSPEIRRSAIIVKYEDLKAAPQATFDTRIFPHLGADPRPVRSSVKPIPHLPKERGVINYDEIRDIWTDPQYQLHIDPVTFTLR